MTTAQYQITDFTNDTAPVLKAKIDANSAVAARTAAAFQCYAAATPNMTVKVAAGGLMAAGALQEKAIQTSGTITAPVTHPRIDRVVIDQITGVASVVTGAEAASPSAPAIPAGKIPVAQIALATSTTAITNSLITDERPAFAFLSVAGLTEDTTPDLAADFALVWDTSAGAFKKVKLNKIGITADNWARDNILLLFLRDAITSGIASGAMRDGISDAYLTDTIGGTSTNETYSSAGKYYAPASNTSDTKDQNAIGSSSPWNQQTIINRNFSLANNAVVSHVAIQSNTATTFKVKVFGENSSSQFTVMAESSVSHGGTGWEFLELATPYKVPSSGTYRCGYYFNGGGGSFVTNLTSALVYAYYTGDGLGTFNKTGDVTNGNVPPCGVRYITEYQNMTLTSATATAQSAPTSARIVVLHKAVDAITLNTDFTAEVTRDGGTTYTAITLTNVGAYDTDYNILEGTADISGQPSGTSMKYLIKTLNNKSQRVKGTALAWG